MIQEFAHCLRQPPKFFSPYPYSTDIFDLFTAPDLAKEFQFKPIKLIDLTTIPDDDKFVN